MSNTPRTEKELFPPHVAGDNIDLMHARFRAAVSADFARGLERENKRLREDIVSIKHYNKMDKQEAVEKLLSLLKAKQSASRLAIQTAKAEIETYAETIIMIEAQFSPPPLTEEEIYYKGLGR